jgi:hypothetical protein
MGSQAYTVGVWEWEWPAGVTEVTARCWGAGGNGGSATGAYASGGGGSGGGFASAAISKGSETKLDIIVGPGGGSIASVVSAGGTSKCLALPGASAANANWQTLPNGPGADPTIGDQVGDVTYVGGAGADGNALDPPPYYGGGGGGCAGSGGDGTSASGSSGGGNGGDGGTGEDTPGNPGGAFGGGGGGGRSDSLVFGESISGGEGGPGYVVLEWETEGGGGDPEPVTQNIATGSDNEIQAIAYAATIVSGDVPGGGTVRTQVSWVMLEVPDDPRDQVLTTETATAYAFGWGASVGLPARTSRGPKLILDLTRGTGKGGGTLTVGRMTGTLSIGPPTRNRMNE